MSEYNVLLISIDSLRRDMLDVYGTPFDWVTKMEVATPNIDRFAEKAAVFDTHYVSSLPCMPARREWLTGTQEFLWRAWGPIESFDTTLPQRLRDVDVLTQLITDHFHYFQHGSNGYFEDYHGYEFIRGHEDDAWKTTPYDPDETVLQQIGYDLEDVRSGSTESSVGRDNPATDPYNLKEIRPRWSYARNVASFEGEQDFFAPKVMTEATSWLEDNIDWHQWFLYVDEFDVHEPFHCPEPYTSMYTDEDPDDPDLPLWPYYGDITAGQSRLNDRELDFVRSQYAGKVTMVDEWVGNVFDKVDELGLWDDTVVIVTSDHGHFLGEYDLMGKPSAPDYDVLARTPLLIWHPKSPRMGERISALTSAIDIHNTILDSVGAPLLDLDHSRSLLPLLWNDTDEVRDWAVYGWWGSTINVTDGQYTYMQPCRDDMPATCYSTSQMDPWGWMGPRTPKKDAQGGKYLPYTDTPVWKFKAPPDPSHDNPLLFDVNEDPAQRDNLTTDTALQTEMQKLLIDALEYLDAPEEQFDRFYLEELR